MTLFLDGMERLMMMMEGGKAAWREGGCQEEEEAKAKHQSKPKPGHAQCKNAKSAKMPSQIKQQPCPGLFHVLHGRPCCHVATECVEKIR